MLQNNRGFTLLEILIALFIFSIVSVMMASALHTVINAQSGSERHAERLRNLQMTLLLFSRDVEQAVGRAVINASGRPDLPFVGAPQSMSFTHGGIANPDGSLARTSLQRVRYDFHDQAFWRVTWPVLDQAPTTKAHTRRLFDEVEELRFQYLDHNAHFQNNWPGESSDSPLPLAVKVTMKIANWGSISQVYVIPTKQKKNPAAEKF